MTRTRTAVLSSLALAGAAGLLLPLLAQAPDNADIQARLRTEETNNSKAMWIMHGITDVHSPRLTGSPTLKAADDWVVATMTSFGLKNAHLEGWDFGHPGWVNHLITANATVPFEAPLEVRPLAWSPSTKGEVAANAVLLLPPGMNAAAGGGGGRGRGAADGSNPAQAGTSPPPMPPPSARPPAPTRAELDAYLATMKDKVRGAVVFVGPQVLPAENFTPAPLRTSDANWEARGAGGGGRGGRGAAAGTAPAAAPGAPPAAATAAAGAAPAAGGRAGRGAGRGAAGAAAAPPGTMTADQVDVVVTRFLFDNGAAVRVENAGEQYGVIRAQDVLGYNEASQVPAMMMRAEDYNRIARLLADGTAVKVRVNIQNEFYPDGKTAYNAVGEIPGTDKADEVVMLGGHFDSWAGGTGATDNGAGSTIMLEAIRLLQALNVKPRRTIRVALWSGEEQGLLGSMAYVDHHFGTAENPKPEWYKLDAYLNIDDGTGKPRAAGVFGPPEAASFVANALAGFKDWGFYGASASRGRNLGGTDSTSFNHAGLPGIGFNQDPFDYNSFTHHTNLDTYERIYEPDIREAAVEAAAAAYALAMAPDMLPRFSKDQMPAPAGDEVLPSRLLPASKKSAGGAQ